MYFSHLNLKRWLLWISDWCIVSSYPSIPPGQPCPQAGHLSAVPQAEQLPEPRQKPSPGSYYYPPGRGKLLIRHRQRFFAHLFLPAEEREGGEGGGERKLCDALCISEYLSNMYIKVNGDILELKLRMSTP